MASTAVESKSCQCVCEQNEGGECVCVCTVPCAFGAANKTVEWTCDCKCGNTSCRCKFQVKCNRKEEDGPCCGDDSCERNEFICKCRCTAGECTLKISKCKCCEVTQVDCGEEAGCCGGAEGEKKTCSGSAGSGSGGCC